jgi:hypothetical protein
VKFGAGFTVSEIVVVCFVLPDVPVTVTVAAPVVAVALAVNVSVLVLVAGFGLNAAVTPVGRPDAENVTVPLNPFKGVIVILLVAVLPSITLTAAGEAARVNAGVTFSAIVVVCVRLPDVPVIVTVAVPVVAVPLTVNVSVLVAVVGFGLNAAVTPVGKPDAASVTSPLKPFSGVTVIVLVPVPPCTTVTAVGEAASV